MVAPARFELAMMESESIALPLGDGAVNISNVFNYIKNKHFCKSYLGISKKKIKIINFQY